MAFRIFEDEWYACTFTGDEFTASGVGSDACPGSYCFSPIKVQRFEALKTGQHKFRLSFWHLNYPQGVQDKVYELRKIAHGKTFLIAVSEEHSPTRILTLKPMTAEWLRSHFGDRGLPEELIRRFSPRY